MSNPFLSVIIPVYNVEQYLPRCLDSILAQTFTDFEVLLVDDGSTDSSAALCDSYTGKDSRFRCFHKENGGHTSARQAGLQHAAGTYVTFVDSDDWIHPDMYQKMCGAARETGADTVCCNYIASTPKGEIQCRSSFQGGLYEKARLEEQVYPRMIYSGTYFTYGEAPSLCNKIFRRGLLEKHLCRVPLSVKIGEDALASYICLLESSSVYFCEEYFYYYRSSSSSLTHSMDEKRLAENRTLFTTLLQIINPSVYPYMERQLDYYIVYQCLLTFAPVFSNITGSGKDSRTLFRSECAYPPVKKAFRSVKIFAVTGLHNRLFTFCIRHRLYGLFRFFLAH
ncbi:MAG: glycosyltransferase [Lachnospiraceae bacterium]|nr:glycosyltransferase [Lachnospiraceae bacterium]